MKALIVYCHPKANSFTAAVLQTITESLSAKGAEMRITDLYQSNFQPILTDQDLTTYEDTAQNTAGIERHIEDIRWCDTLIFIYPTWWYGLPAMLKGWLDRTLVPGVAFQLPDDQHKNIRPGLTHITRLGVFTTCGASRWLTLFIGAPGKRTLLRGVGLLCAKPLKTTFLAHYLMDSSTPASRKAHLDRITKAMDRFIS